MPDIEMKKGDRLPALYYQLIGPEGPLNLAGYTVEFAFELADGSGVPITGACTIDNESLGIVKYSWGAADTAVAGTYNAEFVGTVGGLEISFPNNAFLELVIYDDVA